MRNTKRIVLALLSLSLLLGALFALSSCGGKKECDHEWYAATCTAPKTCKLCSETEGEALGHTGGTSTCTEKARCSRCSEAYGVTLAHDFAAATCVVPKTCKHCSATEGAALGHSDGNKDHKCDRCAAEGIGVHEDRDGDGKCDYCGASGAFAKHEDLNKDHACDCGCTKVFGKHEDGNKDHDCDWGCSELIGSHKDTNKDHKCDYCAKGEDGEFGAHEDLDKDHACDYCGATGFGECVDANHDHVCDYGCSAFKGTCSDSAEDADHVCDYGCGKALEDCLDADKDHVCDNGCDKAHGVHADADKDHICDYGCSAPIAAHEDANKDHKCDYCAKGADGEFGAHADSNKDHKCDYCGEIDFGECVDADRDHVCDYGCSVFHGVCADSAEDADHVCDYGCDKVLEDCGDADKDHACDHGCDKTFGVHKDLNTDHKCDYCQQGADGEFGAHEDSDKDHKCDYCLQIDFGVHEDTDKNHVCDYGCADFMGACSDSAEDTDHVCDWGCGKVLEDCGDADKDHACDNGCDEIFGEHTDADLDHNCDWGCSVAIGEHADADFNHACDYGCDKTFGTCADSAEDTDHVCDYGCGKVLETCLDVDQDHACDHGCDKFFGKHEDSKEDTDHICDYCNKGDALETCEDLNKDHHCDNGCDKTFGTCADSAEDTDHVCDYGCGKVLESHKGGNATCKDAAVCEICGVSYGAKAGHDFTAEVMEPAYIKDAATCLTSATYYYSCSVCGVSEGDSAHLFTGAAATGHSYGEWTVEETESGNQHVRTCAKCLEKETGACAFVATADGENNGSAASCLKPAKCSVCGNEYGDKLGHAWDDGEVTTPATCITAGERTYRCTRNGCGETKTETIAPTGHSYGEFNVTTPATCTTAGERTAECACGDKKTEPIAATGHTPGPAATCTTAQYCTVESCGAELATAKGHTYTKTTKNATCTEAQVDTYTCACGESYTETVGTPIDHDFAGVTPVAVLVEGETCVYDQYYKCNSCQQEIKGGSTVTNHVSWAAQITKAATCVAKGEKLLTCTGCGETKTEDILVDTVLGHDWDEGVTENGVTTYTCKHNGAHTKTVKVITSESTLSKDDLKNELETENGTKFDMDEGVQDLVGDGASLSSGEVNKEDLNLTDEQKNQIGNAPVYEFVITKDGETISNFGGNKIKVTLPYNEPVEDADSVAIWFIGDDGQLTSIKATYNNGYVTFETDHFSKYTVTRLTPKERCKLYGCSSTFKTIAPTCVADGYRLEFCVRCGDSKKHYDEDLKALGHNYTCETTAATCTTAGASVYTCGICDSTYTVVLPALNHSFVEISREDATCENPGKAIFACENNGCDESYEQILPQLAHEMRQTVTSATCTAGGYTTHYCANDGCDYSYVDTYTAALGHVYEDEDAATLEWYGKDGEKSPNGNPNNGKYDRLEITLTCDRCEEKKVLGHDEIDLTKEYIAATCTKKGQDKYVIRITVNGKIKEYLVKEEVLDDLLGHKYGEGFNKYDDENHWKQCICGEIDGIAPHSFDDGIVTKAATCTAEGEITYTCDCGYTKTEIIPKENHSFDGAFEHNENGHWQLCSACGTASEAQAHAFGNARVTKAATCAEAGEKISSCACGFDKTEVIAATGNHIYDESDIRFDENGHWFVCRTCSGVFESSEHSLERETIKAPTCTEPGEESVDCACGYHSESAEIPALGHAYTAEDLTYDENGHWFVCTVCESVCEYAEHALSEIVTKAPTCTEAGELTVRCDCGYVASVTALPALDHSLSDAKSEYNENGHWLVCGVCGDAFMYEDHSESAVLATKEPTCVKEGEKTVLCECGYVFTVVIPNLGGAHTVDESDLKYDENQHWNECSVCGELLNFASHAYGEPVVTETPTCAKEGKSVATCACGKTHVEILPKNDNHTPDSKLSFSNEGHWTMCLACGTALNKEAHVLGEPTETKAPTCAEKGESLASCACGFEVKTEIPATGEHTPGETLVSNAFKHWYECTVCSAKCSEEAHSFDGGFCEVCGQKEATSVDTPDGFYVTLLNSYKNITGAAIRVNNFQFFVDGGEEGSIQLLDVAELVLYVEDGKLCGAAKGGIKIFNGPYSDAYAYYAVEAVIDGDYVYIALNGGRSPDEQEAFVKYTVKEILAMMMENAADIETSMAADIVSFFAETVIPTMDLLISANADEIERNVECLLQMIFTMEEADDGSFIFRLDVDKLRNLNENLYNLTIAEVIDLYFGEGSFDKIATKVKDLLNKKIGDLPEMAEKQGIDLDALIEELNAFYATMGAPADFDIGELIYSEEYQDIALGLLFSNDENYAEFLDQIIAQLQESTFYSLIADGDEDVAFETISAILDLIEGVELSFVTDAAGNLIDVVINVSDFSIEIEGESVDASVSIEITPNGKIDVTWSDIVERIESAIQLPTEDMKENEPYLDFEDHFGEMEYKGEYYEYEASILYIYRTNYDRLLGIMMESDCTDWMRYQALYAMECARYGSYQLYDENGDVAYLLLINEETGETAELVMGEDKVIAILEDGTEIEIDPETLGGVEAIIIAVFGEVEFTTIVGRADPVSYYYNATLDEYSEESQHNYEVEIEQLGDNCEQDGIRYTYTCLHCGYVYSYTNYWCERQEGYLDLSEDGCGGYIEYEYCADCGTVYYVYDLRLGCKVSDEDRVFEEIEGGQRITATCPDCGLVGVMEQYVTVESVCVSYSHENIYLYKDEACIFEYENTQNMTSHEWAERYEMKGETCEDGYIVYEYCERCGEDFGRWHTSGHRVEFVKMDLSELGGCEGGRLYYEGCKICGEIVSLAMFDPACKIDPPKDFSEYVDEMGIVHMYASVACPDCGLEFYMEMWQVAESTCILAENQKIVVYSGTEPLFSGTSTYYRESHNWQTEYTMHGETCMDGWNAVEYCDICGMERDFMGGSGHFTERVEINLSEYGACGGYAYVEHCRICGETVGAEDVKFFCEFSYSDTSFTDDNGVEHTSAIGVCPVCGLTIFSDSYNVQESVCVVTHYNTGRVEINGEEIFCVGEKWSEENHDYVYEYKLYGESCKEGYDVVQTCTKCDLYHEYRNYGHLVEREEIDLRELGLCDGFIVREYCLICDENMNSRVEDYGCNWMHISGNGDVQNIYKCRRCGAEKHVSNYKAVGDSPCSYRQITTIVYYVNNEEIYRYETTSYMSAHKWEWSFTLHGETCEDGYMGIGTCVNCGVETSTEGSGHGQWDLYAQSSSEGCLHHNVRVSGCACGENRSIYFDEDSFISDVAGVYYCPNCDLKVYNLQQALNDGCTIHETCTVSVMYGEETLYYFTTEESYIRHAYAFAGVAADENGLPVITFACSGCGAENETVFQVAELVYNEETGWYYYDLAVTPEANGTYVIMSYTMGDTHVTLYELVDGALVYLCENDDGREQNNFRLEYDLEAGKSYVYRIRFLSANQNGTIVYTLQATFDTEEGGCYHEDTRDTHVVYNDEADKCGAGKMIYEFCTACGEFFSLRESYGHTGEGEYVYFEEFGLCGGYVYTEYCVDCGAFIGSHVQDYVCNWMYEGRDEADREIYCCANCGVRKFNYTYLSEKDASCRQYVMCVNLYEKDGEEVFRFEYRIEERVEHSYEISYVLNGASCDNGYRVVHTCADCGDSYFYESWGHSTDGQIYVSFSDYGACGGYGRKYVCTICGRDVDTYVYDNSCRWETASAENGVTVYRCVSCGMTKTVADIPGEKDEHCRVYGVNRYVYATADGEVIFTRDSYYQTERHIYQNNFEMYGESCNDGFKAIRTCADCDYYEENEYFSHMQFTVFSTEGVEGLCFNHRDGKFYVNSCPCGQEIGCNFPYMNHDGEAYYCEECALRFRESSEYRYEGCKSFLDRSYVIMLGEQTLYELSTTAIYENHKFAVNSATIDESGLFTSFVYTCESCGEIKTDRVSVAMPEVLEDGSTVCDITFTIEQGGDYRVSFDSYLSGTIYTVNEDGSLSYYTYFRGYSTSVWGNEGTTYVLRMNYSESIRYMILPTVNNTLACQHAQIYSSVLLDTSESCEDGALRICLCERCGMISPWNDSAFFFYNTHQTTEKYISLSDYGLCGGSISISACACGETKSASFWFGCSYEHSSETYVGADGKTRRRENYVCSSCGMSAVIETYNVIGDCRRVICQDLTISIGDQTFVFDGLAISSESLHSYIFDYVFDNGGASCTDGVTVNISCAHCDYTRSNRYTSHNTFEIARYYLSDYGVCNLDDYYSISACACGYNVSYRRYNASCSMTSTSNAETLEDGTTVQTTIHTCTVCGFTFTDVTEISVEGCERIERRILSGSKGGVTIFTCETEKHTPAHDFTKATVSVVGGQTVVVAICDKCGTEKTSARYSVTLENHDGKYYYDVVFTPEETGVYTIIGAASGDSYVTLYKLQNEELVQIAYNDDGAGSGQFLLAQTLTAGETYVYRIRFYNQSNSGTIPYIFVAGTYSVGSCNHGNVINVTMLAEGATSCEDGVITCRLCKDCGDLRGMSESNTHTTSLKESFKFAELCEGACGGYLDYYECLCGEVCNVNYNIGCSYSLASEIVLGEDGIYHYKNVYSCKSCALCWTVDSYIVTAENCVRIQYRDVTVAFGEEEIFSCKRAEYSRNTSGHDYVYSYAFAGDKNCESGVTVTTTCKNCDYTATSERTSHVMDAHKYYTSDFGACGMDRYFTYSSCACGYNSSFSRYLYDCSFSTTTKNETDANGISHRIQTSVCQKCGLTIVSDRYTAAEGCDRITREVYTVTMGETVIAENLVIVQNRYQSHTYGNPTYTFNTEEQNCESGVTLHYTCKDCGYSYDSYETYHSTFLQQTVDLAAKGACEGSYVELYACACGHASSVQTYFGCSFTSNCVYEKDANGRTIEIRVYTCETCGLVYRTESYSVSEGCERVTYSDYSFVIGEESLAYTGIASNRTIVHNYRYEYTFSTEERNCENGVQVHVSCETCDYENSYEYRHHSRNEIARYYLSDYGACGASGYIIVSSCPCGYDTYVSENYACGMSGSHSYETDENGISHEIYTRTCSACGLTIMRDSYTVADGCHRISYREYAVSIGETELISGVKDVYSTWDEHTYNAPSYTFDSEDENCASGVTLYYECTLCDYSYDEHVYYHQTFVKDHVDISELGGCEGTYFYLYSCACGHETSLNYSLGNCVIISEVERVATAEGEYIKYTNTCSECGLVFEELQYAKNLNCYRYMYRDFSVTFNGEKVLSCKNSRYPHNSYEDHDMEYTYTFKDGENCENGVTVYAACKNCDYTYESETDSHSVERVAREWLFDYGACNIFSYVEMHACACGYRTNVSMHNSCAGIYTYNTYYDEDDIRHEVNAYRCDSCNLRYQEDYYIVKDRSTCTQTTYVTLSVNVGASLVAAWEYTNTVDSHDYKITNAVLREGATDCSGGVILTYTCADCSESYTSNTYGHERFEIARYDLQDEAYGAALCHGDLVERACVCGRYHEMMFDTTCEIGASYGTDFWIEGALSGYNPIAGAWDSYSRYFGYSAQRHTCAVTDPEQCGYTVRYATYWLPDAKECMAYEYQTWQLGYDAETDTYAYEITFKTGSSKLYHPYTVTDLSETYEDGSTKISGTRYDCPLCGSYAFDKAVYNENGRRTEYERYAENKLDNGATKISHTITTYDDSGRTLKSYSRTVYANGREALNHTEYMYHPQRGQLTTFSHTKYTDGSWRKYEYTYNFEGTCERIVHYTDNSGADTTTSEGFHSTRWDWTKNPTCTQDGFYDVVCQYCPTVISENNRHSPYDHSWDRIFDSFYVCTRCGIENVNGASGDIVMEDMTALLGNGEYYVAGYWARNQVQFTYYVSLILRTPMEDGNDEVVLFEVEVLELENARALAFSKAAVLAAAEALGYSADEYDVRVSFVPVGADGSFDYAVTFTGGEYDGEPITESTSAAIVMNGYEEKDFTIAPTESGVWMFTSACGFDSYGYLYRVVDGKLVEVAYNDDGRGNQFYISYHLEAGETYVLRVRPFNAASNSGESVVSVYFVQQF